jgi:hypothetical protein
MTTTAQDAALAAPHVYLVYFVKFSFKTVTQYASTANIDHTWGGHTWLGLGAVGGISEVSSTEGMDTSSVTISLNAAELTWLTLALGDASEYQNLPIKIYMCPMTSAFQLIDTPEPCWEGVMDALSIGVDNDQGSLQLKCESTAYSLKRLPVFRLNKQQWNKFHPTDKGLDYVEKLISDPVVWLSKKFQQI